MCFVCVQNYTKTIKNKKVLDNINLYAETGSTIGIIGKNGSGKTMLLRAVSGLIRPSSGKIIIDGQILTDKNPFPNSLGVVIEPASLWGCYTAYETLQILAGIRKIVEKEEILVAMERMGLSAKSTIPVGEFSLGMKKRLLIAQAIMEHPKLLVLDEPTNALDDEGVCLFRRMIEEEHQRKTTIFIASHMLEEIKQLCSVTYCISGGKINTNSSELDLDSLP